MTDFDKIRNALIQYEDGKLSDKALIKKIQIIVFGKSIKTSTKNNKNARNV